MWIDAHCHLASERWDALLSDEIAKARGLGISAWIQGGVDPADWDRQEAVRKQVPSLVTCFGLHPWWVGSVDDAEVESGLRALEKRLPSAGALGELGLDAAPKHVGSLPRQTRAFERQLDLLARPKPLVLHVVQAHEQALALLEKRGPFERGGIVHAFNGDIATARRYLALGLVPSVGGAVLRPGYKTLKAAIPLLPPEGLVIETDENSPADLVGIAQTVAALRNEDGKALLDRSSRTLERIFGLNK